MDEAWERVFVGCSWSAFVCACMSVKDIGQPQMCVWYIPCILKQFLSWGPGTVEWAKLAAQQTSGISSCPPAYTARTLPTMPSPQPSLGLLHVSWDLRCQHFRGQQQGPSAPNFWLPLYQNLQAVLRSQFHSRCPLLAISCKRRPKIKQCSLANLFHSFLCCIWTCPSQSPTKVLPSFFPGVCMRGY